MAGQVEYTVVTPEAQVAAGAAESVVLPAHDGELGVLRRRAPLMCELGIGQLRCSSGGQASRWFIDGGFAQVNQDTVTVLTSRAVPAEGITAEMVSAAEQAVEAARGTDVEPEERQKVQRRASALRALSGSR